MIKRKKEEVERVILKLPRSVAEYFRKTFPHGKRSDFIAQCILDYKQNQEIDEMERELKKVGKNRQ